MTKVVIVKNPSDLNNYVVPLVRRGEFDLAKTSLESLTGTFKRNKNYKRKRIPLVWYSYPTKNQRTLMATMKVLGQLRNLKEVDQYQVPEDPVTIGMLMTNHLPWCGEIITGDMEIDKNFKLIGDFTNDVMYGDFAYRFELNDDSKRYAEGLRLANIIVDQVNGIAVINTSANLEQRTILEYFKGFEHTPEEMLDEMDAEGWDYIKEKDIWVSRDDPSVELRHSVSYRIIRRDIAGNLI